MTVPLSGREVRFGRAEDCDVVLVADEVSRHHATICFRDNKSVLVDLKSLNGTYVNRQRIVERVLSHLDEIWFGSKCRVVFRDDTQFGNEDKSESVSLHESRLLQSMSRIREEMDQVGSSMTLIGRRTPVPDHAPGAPSATPEDLQKMGRAYRRMASLYKASQVMASNFDLNRRLSTVLDIVMEVMGAERGFVMLREEETHNLTVKVAREMGQDLQASSPSMGIAGRSAIDGEPVLMLDRNSDQEFGMRDSIIASRILAAMCVPLRIENRILGSIYVDTRTPGATFGEEDLELFMALASQSALAIDNVQMHERLVESEKRRQNLNRFLPSAVVDKILNDDTSLELGGQKTVVTTMFCDIRGSTAIAEQLTPHELVALLNEHFTALTEVIFNHRGTLDKYIGDEIMAVFGAPLSTGDDPFAAVCAALAIQERNAELNAKRRREGKPELQVGIGIDTGEAIAGYIGSPMRMEFTVVGDRVNTAKRFCDLADGGAIVAGQTTWDAINDRVNTTPIGTLLLKGKEQPVHGYKLISLKAGADRA
jgi:adenylate cyclase